MTTTRDTEDIHVDAPTGVPATRMQRIPKEEAEPINALDPLNELLNMDTAESSKVPTDEVDMSPRFKIKWVVQALNDTLNERLLEEASEYKRNPRTGQQVRELNTQAFARLVIFH